MMVALNEGMVRVADHLFGWILFLPRDAALCCVAALSSAALTLLRRWTTNQEWLRRAQADEIRQKQLHTEARKLGDREAAQRHADVMIRIKLKTLRYEIRPLLWAMVPITLLVTWAYARLAYVPPRLRQVVEIRATLPHAAMGQLVHLTPEPGLAIAGDWVQPVGEDHAVSPATAWDQASLWLGDNIRELFRVTHDPVRPADDGVAVWSLIALDTQPHRLKIRYAGSTYEVPFCAGTRRYADPVTIFSDSPVRSVEVVLTPTRLFDFVGSIDWLFLPAWLVAYLLIAIPAMMAMRRLLRIA